MPLKPLEVQENVAESGPSSTLKVSALLALVSVFAFAAAAYFPLANHLSLGHDIGVAAAVLLVAIYALVFRGLQYHHGRSFGLANGVTAVRAAMVSLIAAAVFSPASPPTLENAPWSFVAFVLMALVLDGLDGYLARRSDQVSELGARFDMEIDALLILCLSATAFTLGKVGSWVLLIGLMRYVFVVAQVPVPLLAGRLQPSLRRKIVCVVQVAVLCIILVPFVTAPVSSWLAALALVLLSYSFAVDCIYLLSEAGGDEQ